MINFERFLAENDTKRTRAKKRKEDEEKARKEKEHEIVNINE